MKPLDGEKPVVVHIFLIVNKSLKKKKQTKSKFILIQVLPCCQSIAFSSVCMGREMITRKRKKRKKSELNKVIVIFQTFI